MTALVEKAIERDVERGRKLLEQESGLDLNDGWGQ